MSAIVNFKVQENNDVVETVGDKQQGDFRKEFVCPEESMRYAGSLEQLVFSRFRSSEKSPTLVEFGSGTGNPVVSAILNSNFFGTVHGYEVNPEAAEMADHLIERMGLSKQYIIHNMSFFETQRLPHVDYLIANPPYLPCCDGSRLTLPGLWGGVDGDSVSKKLLSSGYDNVFLEVSSYSNPIELVKHALSLGYRLIDFQISQMPFGVYSHQDIVQERIHEMKRTGKAFFSDKCYLVGSAFFAKGTDEGQDLSSEFLACLTSLK
ncbi:MAG: hypothetical protein WC464_09345 [Bdellovibrionales bacterium]